MKDVEQEEQVFQHSLRLQVMEQKWQKEKVREFNGKPHILESALTADFVSMERGTQRNLILKRNSEKLQSNDNGRKLAE